MCRLWVVWDRNPLFWLSKGVLNVFRMCSDIFFSSFVRTGLSLWVLWISLGLPFAGKKNNVEILVSCKRFFSEIFPQKNRERSCVAVKNGFFLKVRCHAFCSGSLIFSWLFFIPKVFAVCALFKSETEGRDSKIQKNSTRKSSYR